MPVKGFCEHKGLHEVYTKEEVDTLLTGEEIEGLREDITAVQEDITKLQEQANGHDTSLSTLTQAINTTNSNLGKVTAKAIGKLTFNNTATEIFSTCDNRHGDVHIFVEGSCYIGAKTTQQVITVPEGYRPTGTIKILAYIRNKTAEGNAFDDVIPVTLGTDGQISLTANTVDVNYFLIDAFYRI